MPVKMAVMHFVCPSNCPNIGIVVPGEPFESLVNNDIMNYKIGEAIKHNTKTDRLQPPNMPSASKIYQQYADCKAGIFPASMSAIMSAIRELLIKAEDGL